MGLFGDILNELDNKNSKFRIGEFVRVKQTLEYGEIVGMVGKYISVKIDGTTKVFNYTEDELEKSI